MNKPKIQPPSPLAEAHGSASDRDDVDSFDEPNGSENTVSERVRRYTSWGLPPARAAMLKNHGITTNQ